MKKHLPRYDFTGRASRESKIHKMNIALFVKRSTSSARKAKDETDEEFVKRLTHLLEYKFCISNEIGIRNENYVKNCLFFDFRSQFMQSQTSADVFFASPH